MSVDDAAVAAVRAASPLTRLRAFKWSGLTGAVGQVRALLGDLSDPLDLEAAGMLIGGAAQREQLAAAGGLHTQRIALLGSSTMDALPHLLTAALVRDGVLPEIRMAGFNQWRFEILAGAPHLADLAPRIVACLLDDSAVLEGAADGVDIAAVEARCAAFPAELAEWLQAARRAVGGLVVLCTIPLSPLRRDRFIDYGSRARLDAAWDRMNAAVLDLSGQPATLVLSAAGIAAHAGAVFAADRMRHAAGAAFAPDFLRAYAEELSRVARADLGRVAKCLVLDLDNTLWGGVVGDDGVAALRLGGAYPGSAYRELQVLARELAAQGVLLAVCSKNDEEVAREAIATHPEMVLRPGSFVAVHANWQPKPDNVRALAEQLNLGIDAMVFVDDNPAERGLMHAAQPTVTTVDLPDEPAGYAARLAARGDFVRLALTGEDRARTQMYQAQARRAELERSAVSMQDYIVELDSHLAIEPRGPLNTARIAQLFGKTNQFNLTGLRYGQDEAGRSRAGFAFYGARLRDRFGDSGLIAAVALGRAPDGGWAIDNFVLSCRAFSRNIEETIVGLILRGARRHGAPAVTARFVETDRNGTFAGFYPSLGFVALPLRATGAAEGAGVAEYRHSLRDLPELPTWVRLTHDEEVFDAL
ncbi:MULTISPECIES: HAD-IIIC family phosphatase [unclassified Frankia]